MKNNKIENSQSKFLPIIKKLEDKDYIGALKKLNHINQNENNLKQILKLKSFIYLQLKDWNKVIFLMKNLLS